MTFFESLLVLLLAAIVLLQISRRLSLPYPAMLATAGVAVALIPGAPTISFEPNTALALFMAPAVVDAAYDFPLGAARRFRGQLIVFAVVAVLVTTVLVAWIGWKFVGLPVAAALALGAIVAPPDAAAATAVLRAVSIPRDANAVLKGESLFNDATALLLFSAALAVLSNGALTPGVGFRLALAVPGGLLLGIGCALLFQRLNRFVKNTLGGNLLQFVLAFLIWIVAEHLRVSAVLCTIAFAMTIARNAELTGGTRMRVQSFAVWSAVVFALNVFAFLLMGLQGRTILARMEPAHLRASLAFAGVVVLAVVVARLAVAISFNRLNSWWERSHRRPEPISWRQAVFEGWSGMRGFVTLATAFALPASFPQRDLAVLTAFSVVLATLVLQGLTLAPLIRLLKLDQGDALKREVANGRSRLASVALAALDDQTGAEVENVRYGYLIQRDATNDPSGTRLLKRRRELGLAAIVAQREELERMRAEDTVGDDVYLLLQEELDWNELTLLCDDERRIEES
ncbi:MAG TPA: cation:proton antiporter [Bryobacteraceae bacterium]|nr:cation:proton antiporter [Bryobacteraceae bacterium]